VSRKYVLLLSVALGIVLLDQWTKYLAVAEFTTRFVGLSSTGERLGAFFSGEPVPSDDAYHFRPRGERDVVDGYLRLHHAENKGAAWGLFGNLPEHVRAPLFHLVSLGAVVLISLYYRKLSDSAPAEERWARWGLPLVLGGALGNYVDRLTRGFVVDFIQAHWQDRAYWPSFNVADMAISVGVGLLMVDALVRKEKPAPAGSAP
jgi:signal peptidase II